jgi:maltose O-acetyltransferase
MSLATEKQRMLAGELYLASDSELVTDRRRARDLLREYNATSAAQIVQRVAILSCLFGGVGQRVEIEPPFYCDYGYNIFAGNGLYMNFGCVVLDCASVRIGENVLIGPYVQLCAACHPTDPEIRRTGRELAAPIRIGSNVWIGGGAIICNGVSIGEDTTIGAGSVVVADVPRRVVAAGNPCRVLRKLG